VCPQKAIGNSDRHEGIFDDVASTPEPAVETGVANRT
jgi:hypothetical protein